MDQLINELFGTGKTATAKMFACMDKNIPFEDYCLAEYEHVKTIKKQSVKPKYAYFITFTLKPDAKEEDAIALINNIPLRKDALGIISMDIVKEHTQNGVAHWHSYITSTKPIKKDRFNYYIRKCGNIDVKKARTADKQEIENYMLKESETITKLI